MQTVFVVTFYFFFFSGAFSFLFPSAGRLFFTLRAYQYVTHDRIEKSFRFHETLSICRFLRETSKKYKNKRNACFKVFADLFFYCLLNNARDGFVFLTIWFTAA